MTAMRRGVMDHMRRSVDTAAHVTSAIEVDMARVVALRTKLKPELAAQKVNLTYLAFIARATVDTILDYPWINGELRGQSIVTRPFVNLGIAVALDERPAAADTIASALDAVALSRQKGLPVRVLSQGQRRRIGLARLHLSQRPLWILDEPLTALDADGVGLLGALLERHLERGGLCVAASHQPLPVAASKLRSITLGATAIA